MPVLLYVPLVPLVRRLRVPLLLGLVLCGAPLGRHLAGERRRAHQGIARERRARRDGARWSRAEPDCAWPRGAPSPQCGSNARTRGEDTGWASARSVAMRDGRAPARRIDQTESSARAPIGRTRFDGRRERRVVGRSLARLRDNAPRHRRRWAPRERMLRRFRRRPGRRTRRGALGRSTLGPSRGRGQVVLAFTAQGGPKSVS